MLFFQLKASIGNASKLLRHHRSTIATSSQALRRYRSSISNVSELSHVLHHHRSTIGTSSQALRRYICSISNVSELWHVLHNHRNYDETYFVNLLEKKIKMTENRTVKYITSGARIHASLVKNGMQSDQILGKLLRLYASTGHIDDAQKFFYECYASKVAGLGVFNAAIIGLGLSQGINIFNNVPRKLVKTQATYWNAMVACVHVGEVEFCYYLLGKIFKNLAIEPAIEHVGTYIDCLARNGQLGKAFHEVRVMVYQPSYEIIVSILWRCQSNEAGEIDLAIKFVEFLERKGISYKVTRQIYTRLESHGIIWKSNVKILRQRRVGQSIGPREVNDDGKYKS